VEQACYQCGATVEEGTAFCPQCNSPQIRVAVPEGAPGAGVAGISTPASYAVSVGSQSLDWGLALSVAALADLLAVALVIVLLGAPFGLGLLTAGFLTVVFYRHRRPFTRLTAGIGMRLGAVSGSLGFGLLFWQRVRQSLLEGLQQAAARNPDPQAQQALEFFKTPAGMVVALIGMFLGFLLLSSLGGMIGAMLLRRKDVP
jgi:RNA polymerase subunit RPABC4/transcription elongation factor Spt4